MSETSGEQAHTLTIERTLDAPQDLVWKAFTERDWLRRWYCPKSFEVIHAEIDPTVGGSWRIGMRSPKGAEYFMGGTVEQADAPSRLTLSQKWEGMGEEGAPAGATSMVIALAAEGSQTRLTFEHRGLPSADSVKEHNMGWSGAFDNLQDCLQESTQA